jgi:hypothetical protein
MIVATLALCGGSLHGRSLAPPDPVPPDTASLLSLFRSPAAEWLARVDAARRLLESPPDADQVAALGALLSDPGADGATKSILLDAIAGTVATPPALFGPVARLAGAAGNEDLPFIVPALGSFRTREAARLLLGFCDAGRPGAGRGGALAALVRLRGRDDLGSDLQGWRTWLEDASILSEADWREQVARDQARRAARLADTLAAARQEITPVYRRLYGQLPPSERPRFLAEVLKDEREELRTLGFQLAALELSAGQTLPPVVSDAAVLLLEDRSAQTRARAAVLLDQIARPETSEAVFDALNREQEPEAAAALLSAAARWPSPLARASILRWLADGPTTRPAAAKAGLSLLRADLLSSPADRNAALETLRAAPLEQLGTSELRLLVLLGSSEDRDRVAGMLELSSPATRRAAAGALAGRPDYLDRLLAAAARDSDLFAIAAESAAASPSAETFRALAMLRAPDETSRRTGLLLVARSLSTEDLLKVAREAEDREFAVALLDPIPQRAAGTDAAGAPAVAQAIEVLADLHLELGQPDRALATLDVLETLQSRFPDLEEGQATNLRVTAYLCLDRLDRAAAEGGDAAAWLRGLTLCSTQPQARRIISELRARFAGRMTPNQLVTFALLESQVSALEAEERARQIGPPEPQPAR